MTQTTDNPLARALLALDRLHGLDLDPVTTVAWQEAWDAVRQGLVQRNTLLEAVHAAQALVEALDDREEAAEAEDPNLFVTAETAVEAAEDTLVEALHRVEAVLQGKAAPSVDEASQLLGKDVLS